MKWRQHATLDIEFIPPSPTCENAFAFRFHVAGCLCEPRRQWRIRLVCDDSIINSRRTMRVLCKEWRSRILNVERWHVLGETWFTLIGAIPMTKARREICTGFQSHCELFLVPEVPLISRWNILVIKNFANLILLIIINFFSLFFEFINFINCKEVFNVQKDVWLHLENTNMPPKATYGR